MGIREQVVIPAIVVVGFFYCVPGMFDTLEVKVLCPSA
jgi:hypothetical protein